MKKNILIGGAWPYANYKLHMGHVAALLPGDIIARYYRQNGDNVVFISGTDCHGTPTTLTAKKEGISPKEVATKFHNFDKEDMKKLGISYDLYASTMDEEHKEEAKRMYKLVYDNGYMYEKLESQDYCERCKTFLSDRDIIGVCSHCGNSTRADQCEGCLSVLENSDLKDKKCSICGEPTTLKENKHLYFALSKFQKTLEEYAFRYSKNWRKNAQNETNKYLKIGLIDRAATRQLDWGVDVPIEGYEDKKIYVWIEAVLGYFTTCKRVIEARGESFEKFITDKNTISYYIHGKDNIVFHSIIYPALIYAMKNDYNLPCYIISSEYLNMKDQKMSKSLGNLMTISEMLSIYEADAIRYYLIANGPEKKDVNFSLEDFTIVHNKFLVGVLGNFINRNLSFIKKKFSGVVKASLVDEKIISITKEIYSSVGSLIEKGDLKTALDKVMDYATLGNKYYDENKTWELAKEDVDKFNEVSYTCIYMMANIANLIFPFIPNASKKINEMLGLKESPWGPLNINGDLIINEVSLLFEKIEKSE